MNIPDANEFAKYIDHTFLKADGAAEPIEKLCEEAKEYGFAMVAINPAEVARCRTLLKGFPTRVGAAIGFPLGQNTVKTKIFEVVDSIESGAQEIDMVINQRALIARNIELVREEIFGLAEACQKFQVISKVILECCNLTDEEKTIVCQIASEAKCDFVKTSTGFGAHGANIEDVILMRNNSTIKVKAAGGIKTLKAALQMLDAGAARLGTSAGVSIIQELLGGNLKETPKTEGY